MDLAKVPDSDVPHWEYVDIFVFSNGQHQTPPRKYHLKSNELEEWQDMLRTLAQSQYGAKQQLIDLYTTDGLKVATPIEVVHENAYVAVPSHDEFIPAGYTDYLLKASRSREKRLGKFKKPITLALTRAEQEKNKLIDKNEEGRSLPTAGGGTTRNNTTTIFGDQHAPQVQTNNNSNNITGKFLDKRTLNNSTLLRKNNPNIPGEMVKKPSMKSKENLLRKNLKVSTGKISSKDPVLIINHNNSFKTKGKVMTKISKDNKLIDNQKKMENTPAIPNTEQNSRKTINEKNTITESALMENVINDKELIVVKNPDSMILDANKTGFKNVRQTVTSTEIPVLHLEESKTPQVIEQEKSLDIISSYVENINKPQSAVNNELSSNDKIDINVNRPSNMLINEDSARKNVLISDDRPTENFVALIEKGDVVSLNLQIEVKKCDGVIKTRYDTNTKKLCSITEKSSQVEIVEEFVQSIENQSNVNNSMAVNEENPKIIVLQCACGNQDFNEILQKIDTSYNLEDKKYVILLPNSEYEKHMQRCKCGLESQVDSARLSVVNPVRKVYKDTKILENTENYDTKYETVPETQNINVSDSQIQSSSRNIQKKELKYEDTVNNNMSKEINTNLDSALLQKNTDDNVLVSYENENENYELNTVQSNISRNIREPESLIVSKNAANVTKQFMESSTQTEWSSILLEARRHDDGLYSFHLPPLSVLKYHFL